jgi:integrase
MQISPDSNKRSLDMKGNTLADGRRTLSKIDRYPTPGEIYQTIMLRSWPYKSPDKEFLIARDRALASLLYLVAIRISEAKRLTRGQFKLNPFRVEGIKLSKAERHIRNIRNSNGELIPIPTTDKRYGKVIVRKDLYRKEARIPLKGERGDLGQLVLAYIKLLDADDQRLFSFSEKSGRIDQIIKHILGIPPHWERAYGENYLYEIWDKDLLAVASYVQVDPRTLTKYIHGTHTKYLDRET